MNSAALKKATKLKQIGASLVEMGLLITLIAIICIPPVTQLGWRTTCKMSLEPYFQNLIRTGPTSFAGPFGTCTYLGVAPAPDENVAMFWMQLFCNSPAHDPWVQQFRDICHI